MSIEHFSYQKSGVFKDKLFAKRALEFNRLIKIDEVDEISPGVFVINDQKIKEIYDNPVYIQESDGIGSKEKLLTCQNIISGHDLVIANTNDLLRWGAKPITVQINFEFTEIDTMQFDGVMLGAAMACCETGCKVTGGETAQRPDFLPKGKYHLGATITGVVEKDKIISGENSQAGDIVLGLPSNGLHTNGYTLVEKLTSKFGIDVKQAKYHDQKLIDLLVAQHKNYYQAIFHLLENNIDIRRIVHVTGGGFSGRLKERLPDSLSIEKSANSFPIPAIFNYIQNLGNISDELMYSTFNMGIGMTLDLPKKEVERAQKILKDIDEESYVIGEVTAKKS